MKGIIVGAGPNLNFEIGSYILKAGGNIVDAVSSVVLATPYFATGSGVCCIRGPGIGNVSVYFPGFFPGMGIDRKLRYELWSRLSIEYVPTSLPIALFHILERWGSWNRNKILKELQKFNIPHYCFVEKLFIEGVDLLYRGALGDQLIKQVAPYRGGLVTKRDLSLVTIKEEALIIKENSKYGYKIFYPNYKEFESPKDKMAYIFVVGCDETKLHIAFCMEFGTLPWRKFGLLDNLLGNWLLSIRPPMKVGKPLKNHFWLFFWAEYENNTEGAFVFPKYSKSLLRLTSLFVREEKTPFLGYKVSANNQYISYMGSNDIKSVRVM